MYTLSTNVDDDDAVSDDRDNSVEDKKGTEPKAGGLLSLVSRIIEAGVNPAETYIRGKRIYFCGPSEAGKTTFDLYLRENILRGKRRILRTWGFRNRYLIRVKYREGKYILIRYTRDTPGHADAKLTADDLKKKKPDFIFFVFDVTKEDVAVKWLKDFRDELLDQEKNLENLQKKLRGAAIILNKCDLLKQQEYSKRVEALENSLRSELNSELHSRTGIGENTVEAFRCSLVQGARLPDGSESQHRNAVRYMAEQLL